MAGRGYSPRCSSNKSLFRIYTKDLGMVPPVNVRAVATAVPPHVIEQRAVADAARQVYARTFARYPKLADVFSNAGIERRYSARSLEWLSAPHDLAERTKVYLESAS